MVDNPSLEATGPSARIASAVLHVLLILWTSWSCMARRLSFTVRRNFL